MRWLDWELPVGRRWVAEGFTVAAEAGAGAEDEDEYEYEDERSCCPLLSIVIGTSSSSLSSLSGNGGGRFISYGISVRRF